MWGVDRPRLRHHPGGDALPWMAQQRQHSRRRLLQPPPPPLRPPQQAPRQLRLNSKDERAVPTCHALIRICSAMTIGHLAVAQAVLGHRHTRTAGHAIANTTVGTLGMVGTAMTGTAAIGATATSCRRRTQSTLPTAVIVPTLTMTETTALVVWRTADELVRVTIDALTNASSAIPCPRIRASSVGPPHSLTRTD